MPEHQRRWPVLLVGGMLVAFGMVAILTIGLPFLIGGAIVLVDAATGVRRRRPRLFWPTVAAVAGFFAGGVAVAPWSCTSEAAATSAGVSTASTTCRSLTGIRYAGGAGYDPPEWPGLSAGITVAVLAGAGTRRWIVRGGG